MQTIVLEQDEPIFCEQECQDSVRQKNGTTLSALTLFSSDDTSFVRHIEGCVDRTHAKRVTVVARAHSYTPLFADMTKLTNQKRFGVTFLVVEEHPRESFTVLPHVLALMDVFVTLPCSLQEFSQTLRELHDTTQHLACFIHDNIPQTTDRIPHVPFGSIPIVRAGGSCAVFATGFDIVRAEDMVSSLEKNNTLTTLLYVPTLNPFDRNAVISAAKECGACVVIEQEHCVGGLAQQIGETLSRYAPVPMEVSRNMTALPQTIKKVLQRKRK
ncbi:MAG: hypothetical protein A2804_03295 [Candidatus Pacebacteria bacterium RIFCSPHIGHO2_01_FULL_46_10]|nr:MAG: hypothetical protein A2804_03295 [Candidatus Pacebacteria bacterium RIFCSPHIGHO2_01_FULL_46_10]